jgi:hypothetical protein
MKPGFGVSNIAKDPRAVFSHKFHQFGQPLLNVNEITIEVRQS